MALTALADDRCFMEASRHYNVPESLLRAVAEIESGNKQYALNIAGASHYPARKADALRLLITDRSFDVGIMQINRWWFDRFNYSYELGLDACWNIKMGAYILAYEISKHGYNWDAVGHYHSHTEQLRDSYIERLIRVQK